jgi:hypothetical protein
MRRGKVFVLRRRRQSRTSGRLPSIGRDKMATRAPLFPCAIRGATGVLSCVTTYVQEVVVLRRETTGICAMCLMSVHIAKLQGYRRMCVFVCVTRGWWGACPRGRDVQCVGQSQHATSKRGHLNLPNYFNDSLAVTL